VRDKFFSILGGIGFPRSREGGGNHGVVTGLEKDRSVRMSAISGTKSRQLLQ
jgi:hypothetical protein